MKTIIAGSREFTDRHLLDETMAHIPWEVTEVVCGCARGADTLGRAWAEEHNIPVKLMPADWDTHGRPAGHMRNKAMARYADALVLFWNGKTKGSKSMFEYAIKHCQEVIVRVPRGRWVMERG